MVKNHKDYGKGQTMIKLLTLEGFWDGDTCSKPMNQNLRQSKLTEEQTIRFAAITFLSNSQPYRPSTLVSGGFNSFISLWILWFCITFMSLYSPYLHFSVEKSLSPPKSYKSFSDRRRWRPPFSAWEELILTAEWGSSTAEIVLGPISIAPGKVL